MMIWESRAIAWTTVGLLTFGGGTLAACGDGFGLGSDVPLSTVADLEATLPTQDPTARSEAVAIAVLVPEAGRANGRIVVVAVVARGGSTALSNLAP